MRQFLISAGTALVTCAVVLMWQAHAGAYGVPTTNTLSYTGTLQTFGAPDNSSHMVSVSLYAPGTTPAVCTSGTVSVTCVNGQFTVPLPTGCVTAVHQNQNLQAQVTVDTVVLGTTSLSAVPYALEADTATNYAPASPIAQLVPSGTVEAYAGAVGGTVAPPPGWLLCDGSAVSRTQYAALFTAIGISAGTGNGTTTFNVPDYRGRFLRGFDQGNGLDPDAASRTAMNAGGNTGDTIGSVEPDQFLAHDHQMSIGGAAWNYTGGSNNNFVSVYSYGAGNFYYTCSNGYNTCNSGGNETRPKNAFVNYIIKT